METAIIGLPQVGKKTLFSLLTNVDIQDISGSGKKEFEIGESSVKDPRFDSLVDMYEPKNEVPAKIQYMLFPAIKKESEQNKKILQGLEKVDVICHVVRCFADDAVFHIEGNVDYSRDIRKMNEELLLQDILFVEKRLKRMEKELKVKKEPDKIKELEMFKRMEEVLNNDDFLYNMDFSDDDKKRLAKYPFLTLKKQIIVLNVNEDDITSKKYIEQVEAENKNPNLTCVQVSAKVEMELSHLEAEEEKKEFLDALGIQESAIDQLTRMSFYSLGLMSFFTVGKDEVRMWTITQGSSAPQAAGAIHSDLERGFIRAEVIQYDDLIRLGSEDAVKQEGLLMVKGKDYIVQDGDIMHIRFNV